MTALHRKIRQWYAAHGRKDLPWRNTQDPYAIYISEIMLQQTQVSTVLERYYFQFLEAFPTITALAEAPEVKVLKAWEGLGYYQRARNLHKAAKTSGAQLPAHFEGLIALPGIGRNTAHAVLAFAHHLPVPVLEANVKRVIARYFAMENPSDAEWWAKAEALLDQEEPFIYNQAMMDVGATICRPKAPLCLLCPLSDGCIGKVVPERYPAKKAAKKVPVRERVIMIRRNKKGQIALIGRSEGRLLGGLYGFPQYTLEEAENMAFTPIGEVVHHYTHFTLQARVGLVEGGGAAGKDGAWYGQAEILALPLSKLDRKVLKILIDRSARNRQK